MTRDLLELSAVELDELRRTVQPLARQLAARIGRRRRQQATGRLDAAHHGPAVAPVRRRPLDPAWRKRHPHRPEVVVLCDVSGSVSEFAQFTFTLVHALHAELSRVRSFAFVDGIVEVTDLFARRRMTSTSPACSNAEGSSPAMATATMARPSSCSAGSTSTAR